MIRPMNMATRNANNNNSTDHAPRPNDNHPRPGRPRRTTARGNFPPESIHILTVPPRRGVTNHSYRDYSQVPPPPDNAGPIAITDMMFAQKVHHILSESSYETIVSWMPHGRAFKVHHPAVFEKQVCPLYFGHTRYSSFLRALGNHGFKHLTKGADRNCKWYFPGRLWISFWFSF